jgi:hypothetical protein
MPFILSCLFYSFIGCLTGFFAHVFNGMIQKHIQFDSVFILKTIGNFVKILGVMTLATLATGILILAIPKSFFGLIGTDVVFLHQLVFYLFAFAAFDFGLKN